MPPFSPISTTTRSLSMIDINLDSSCGYSINSVSESSRRSERSVRTCTSLPPPPCLMDSPASSASPSSHYSSSSVASTGRRVSFSPQVKIRKTLLRSEYSTKERDAAWYAQEELDNIKVENKKIISKIAKSGNKNKVAMAAEDCTRGLECRVPQVAKKRFQRKASACKLVLQEQESGNSSMIAQKYQMLTRDSQMAAFRIGRIDQRDAR